MKTGVFKKLVALAAAVAMVCSFAVCASAVRVTTTTKYVKGTNSEKVSVEATVSGFGNASEANPIEVTYYATNSNAKATEGVVYVDQKTATSNSVTFEFETNAAYLKSDAKVGYTKGAATLGSIDGYTLTCKGETVAIPTAGGSVVIPYTPEDGKTVASDDAVSVTGAKLDLYIYHNSSLTLVLSDVKGNVEVTVAEITSSEAPAIKYLTGGLVIADGENDDYAGVENEGVEASTGDRKLTVVGQVTGTVSEFGIIVSESTITEGECDTLSGDVYSAKEKNSSGLFAVQLIDEGTGDEAYIVEGTDYHTAVYYKTAEGKFFVAVSNETLNVPAANN